MEQNKEEQLKAILSQTLSQDEIEKKLKKEIKATNKKQKKLKKQQQKKEQLERQEEIYLKTINHDDTVKENKEELKIIDNTKPEEVSLNNDIVTEDKIEEELKIIDDTKPEEVSLHNDMMTEDKVEEELKIIDDTKPEEIIIPTVTKPSLEENNSSINNLIYIFAGLTVILLAITIYLFTKEPIQKIVIKEVPVEVVKEVKIEVVKEKIVPKIVDLGNENFNKYYKALKFNSLKCYNFKTGSSLLPKQCKEDINLFFKENEKSIRFEIIPVIAEEDNTIFEKIQPKIAEFKKPFQNKVEEYILRGLSRERVLETSSYIRKNFESNFILTPTNYYVKSKKNNRGIIIKAYYH